MMSPPPRIVRRRRRPRGFTAMELLIVVLILAITAKMAVDVISSTEASMRADRAARETLAALRFARNLATTTGNVSGVEFDTAARKIKVYTMIGATQTWVSVPFAGSGKSGLYQIDLAADREVSGVTLTVTIPSAAANPYDVAFNALGATRNTGTVKFNYSNTSKTLTITSLADPTLN